MATLPEPSFIDRDPVVILADCIAQFEAATGKPLQPTQVERIIIDLIVYRETLLRIGIQETAKQNLRAYAGYPMLDYLAEIIGAARIEAQAAGTTIRITLPVAAGIDTLVPVGTRVRSSDGRVEFATDADVSITVGTSSVDVHATCTTLGVIGNGYAPGQVANLVSDLGEGVVASNTVETSGGAEEETTDQLRDRFPEAVRALSVAGPRGAYRFLAMSAHADILDVAVTRPADGTVRLSVIAKTGAPSTEVLDAVEAAVADDEDVRPLTDTVEVVAATEVPYMIVASLTLYQGTVADDEVVAATARAQAYADARQLRLGRNLVQNQLESALLGTEGRVYDVTLTSPGNTDIAEDEWPSCTSITVTFGGWAEESI